MKSLQKAKEYFCKIQDFETAKKISEYMKQDDKPFKTDEIIERDFANKRNKLKEHKTYYSNGKLNTKCYYKYGKRNGEFLEYYEDGQLDTKCYYKDDKFDGEYLRYHNNGQLYAKCYYKDDKFDGEYLEYYKDGKLYKKCYYKDDKFDGEYLEYYKDGQLRVKCYYKYGKFDDEFLSYHSNGQLYAKCYYKDGEEVTEQEYKEVIKNKQECSDCKHDNYDPCSNCYKYSNWQPKQDDTEIEKLNKSIEIKNILVDKINELIDLTKAEQDRLTTLMEYLMKNPIVDLHEIEKLKAQVDNNTESIKDMGRKAHTHMTEKEFCFPKRSRLNDYT